MKKLFGRVKPKRETKEDAPPSSPNTPPSSLSPLFPPILYPDLDNPRTIISPDDHTGRHRSSVRGSGNKWGLMEERKESGGERDRQGGRNIEDMYNLTRMIGYLVATGSEERSLILEVCELVSTSEANAEEAVKALRRELKYGELTYQLPAARLWAIMLRNSSAVFIHRSTSRKFLETIQDVLSKPQTDPVLRERLLTVLAAAAHMSVSKNDREAVCGLWRKLKSPDVPDNCIPFNPNDTIFGPIAGNIIPSSSSSMNSASPCVMRHVKPCPGGDLQSAKKIFRKAAITWKDLTHSNIVPLLRVTVESFELFLDWMPGSDLPEYIAKRPDADRLSLLSGVADGLRYLHACNVTHGYLNGSNILVDETGHARITDPGVAMITQDLNLIRDTSAERGHSTRWIAPEILSNQGGYSKEADVFSFAGVAIEAFTGKVPFGDNPPPAAISAIMRGKRPPRPIHSSLTEGLWALTQQCWDQDAHLRPHMLRISCCLKVPTLELSMYQPDLFLTCSGPPTWKHLIDPSLQLDEKIYLITRIFSDREETEAVRRLAGDDAQSFVDVVDQMLDSLDGPLRKKALSTLCKICGRQALLPRSLQIPHCYDRSEDALYSGGYSDVWMGEHQDRKVAVKVLRIYTTSNLDKIVSRFCREVITWKSLRHPNVLPLLGVTMRGKHFAMVSEWMSNGSINEFIAVNRDADRFELLKGVARGLIYLHSQGMIHGDLKGANVLIDSSGQARLADFGLLTFISDPTNPTNSNSVTNSGTTRWMSPELLHPEEFGFEQSRPTKKSDCYALGMVILEVLSGEPPFASDKNFIVMRKVIEGQRPDRPEGVWFTDGLWTILEQCWLPRPEDRPTVEAVLECLGQVSETWEPIMGDVETDVDESVSTISEPLILNGELPMMVVTPVGAP